MLTNGFTVNTVETTFTRLSISPDRAHQSRSSKRTARRPRVRDFTGAGLATVLKFSNLASAFGPWLSPKAIVVCASSKHLQVHGLYMLAQLTVVCQLFLKYKTAHQISLDEAVNVQQCQYRSRTFSCRVKNSYIYKSLQPFGLSFLSPQAFKVFNLSAILRWS